MVFRKSIWWSTILNVGNKTRIHHWQYSAAFWSFFYKNRVPACESHMHKNALFKNDQRFLYFFMFRSFFVVFLIFSNALWRPYFALFWKNRILAFMPFRIYHEKTFYKDPLGTHIWIAIENICICGISSVISVYRHKKATRARFFSFPSFQTFF